MERELVMQYISAVDTAKLVRKALKAQWPTVRFSVRTSSSGGALDVTWVDGPTDDMVSRITSPFCGSRRDDSGDGRDPVRGTLDGRPVHFLPDFIFGKRTLSPAFTARLESMIADRAQTDTNGPTPKLWLRHDGQTVRAYHHDALVGNLARHISCV